MWFSGVPQYDYVVDQTFEIWICEVLINVFYRIITLLHHMYYFVGIIVRDGLEQVVLQYLTFTSWMMIGIPHHHHTPLARLFEEGAQCSIQFIEKKSPRNMEKEFPHSEEETERRDGLSLLLFLNVEP